MNNSHNNTTFPSDGLCPEIENGVNSWYICVLSLYAPVALFVDRYISPVLYLLGLFGNLLTIKIWSRRIRRTNTSALYLTVLAVTDLMLLVLHCVMELQFAWNISTLSAHGWCSAFFVMYMFAQYMSPLLILGFTFERFVSIALPFKSERFSKRNRGACEIAIIVVVSVMLASPQSIGWGVLEDGDCQGTGSHFFETWIWISDVLVFCVFPLTSLILNVLVIHAVSKSVKLRRDTAPRYEMTGYGNSLLKTKQKKDQNRVRVRISTVTLLCVSFYRIFTVIPVAIIFALQYKLPVGDIFLPVPKIGEDPVWHKHFNYTIAKKIIDEIGLSQYSCNVFLYYFTANYFKSEFWRLCRSLTECKLSKKLENSLRRNGTDNSTKRTMMSERKSFYD